MSDELFLDTNVLVYVHDDAEPEKQRIARERLALEARRSRLAVSTQVLQELFVALTRGASPIRSPGDAERAVGDASRLRVIGIDVALVFAAIARSRSSRIHFWDALVVETARAGGCTRILSEDLNHGQDFDGVSVENPFAAGT